MILDHIGISVTNYQKSKEFYRKALNPLGIEVIMEFEKAAGFGRDGRPQFWFGEQSGKATPAHIAFVADTREKVRAFHKAALAAGGKDNGGPGVREHYHPNYYGAFVLDPDGHNVEAVCHTPEK